ncbi:MAG: ABC transporter substrate-binding protein [Desulfobacterales bacterium]|nr:ABC transporter substrate-binding protein [Desulfobacterales bacterium]
MFKLRRRSMKRSLFFNVIIVAVVIMASGAARAGEKVTAAALTFVSSSPLFIAQEKGYFAGEGLDVQFKFFRAAQPVAVAIASRDADFGVTAFTAGFFNLAGKGALKVIGAQLHEVKGFTGSAILASNKAYKAGLTEVARLSGHSFAMTQVGSSFHYMIGRVAEGAGFGLESMKLKPLQSVGNMIGALKSGQVDAMIIVPHIAKPLNKAGAAKIIGWVADYAPYQVGGLFTSTKNVNDRRGMVEKFVRAYQKGVTDYRAAFIDGAENQDEIVTLIHKYVYKDQPAAKAHSKIKNGAMYIEKEARLDAADVYKQVAWYKERGLVDKSADPAAFVDNTFIPPLTLPGK